MAGMRVVLSWSGGKDSVLALVELRRDPSVEVVGLVTTVTEGYDRISMHGVRRALLERQAAALGLPLEIAWIPPAASNREYEARMAAALERQRGRGATGVAFGDLFLADVRAYREAWLATCGLAPRFPLWGRDTRALAEAFLAMGFEAVVTCVDTRVLPARWAGRPFDGAWLRDLPPGVDPCGERGEFHTFVHAGPLFRDAVPFVRGEIVRREAWAFCDLLAVGPPVRAGDAARGPARTSCGA
jgi:uncharacterized protein (TIGR00290 family)